MTNRLAALSLTLAGLAVGSALACGGGGGGSPTSPPPPPPPPAGEVVVSVRDNSFEPKSVSIQPGQSVVWQLEGSQTNHNIIAVDGSFNSGSALSQRGSTYRRTFDEADRDRTFEYRCSSHQACCAMQGSVRVGANAPPPDSGY